MIQWRIGALACPSLPRENGQARRLSSTGGTQVEGRWVDRGIGRIMFAVDDIDDVVARLTTHGAELVGEIVQYENMYRLCYLRGPEGILIALAEELFS